MTCEDNLIHIFNVFARLLIEDETRKKAEQEAKFRAEKEAQIQEEYERRRKEKIEIEEKAIVAAKLKAEAEAIIQAEIEEEKKRVEERSRFDLIEHLLMHNLIHIIELIFDYVGFPYTWVCLRVNRLWYSFLVYYLFPRWDNQIMKQDCSICDIYEPQELQSLNPGEMCWQINKLKEVWQTQNPMSNRD